MGGAAPVGRARYLFGNGPGEKDAALCIRVSAVTFRIASRVAGAFAFRGIGPAHHRFGVTAFARWNRSTKVELPMRAGFLNFPRAGRRAIIECAMLSNVADLRRVRSQIVTIGSLNACSYPGRRCGLAFGLQRKIRDNTMNLDNSRRN